jgi:hypothetical protein
MEHVNPLATTKEAAEFLSVKAMTLYAGESGTGHLQKKRLGSKTVRYYWPQIEAHREQIIRAGKCDGECNRVFEGMEQPEPEPVESPFMRKRAARR